ncbi:hypothetical protein BJY04DRAFT_219652 [Aspergillus karnatakaensis]|uniref:nuclear transport factor 2 family protein n=1 Tax=Aspergillus karnatakaensis TaxID=1810916 RepID=UPI003CCCAB3E
MRKASAIMTTLPTLPVLLNPPLAGREAIADTLHRIVLAFDTNDAPLLHSALTPTATMDVNGRVSEGLDAIHKDCFDFVGRLNTTHFVTNMRIHIADDGQRASMTASALSQHYREGQGERGDEERLMAGNLYWVELVKEGHHGEGELWKIERFVVKSTWAEGAWGVMKGE